MKEKILDFIKRDDKGNFYALVTICVLATVFIIYKVQTSQRILITQSVTAIMLGLVAESLRLSKNAKHTFKELLLGYLFSFIIFIPYNADSYDLAGRIATWPAIFIMSYSLTTMLVFKDQVVAKANISSTVVLSLATFYWVMVQGLFTDEYFPFKALAVIVTVLCILTLYHAFKPQPLNQRQRVLLSSWTALIMIALAIDFALGIFLDTRYLLLNTWQEKIYDFAQYFVLGMALVYILQNIYLIYEFISPEKSPNDVHVQRILQTHLKRYTSHKAKKKHTLLLSLLVSGCFLLNYRFEFISSYSAIWIVFIVYSALETHISPRTYHPSHSK